METFEDGTCRRMKIQTKTTDSWFEASVPLIRTVFHFFGELVVLQQGAHVPIGCLRHDGFHLTPIPAETEIKISEPEDLVELGGGISCDYKKQ